MYPYKPAPLMVLLRDGKPLLTGTEQECWHYIHFNTPFSVDHALTHEGYEMRPEGT